MKSRTLARVAMAAAFTCAFAASGQMNAPQRSSPRDGHLEGRDGPPASNISRPPQGRSLSAPQVQSGAVDKVLVRNPTASWVWITIYGPDGGFHSAGCMQPRQERQWELGAQPAAYRVRGELTAKEACGKPIVCDASFQRAPGMPALDLQGGAGGCSWQPGRAAPANLKQQWQTVYIKNKTGRSVWVTVYENGLIWDSIYKVGCINPGINKGWGAPAYSNLRAEVASRPDCQHPLDCDTGKYHIDEQNGSVVRSINGQGRSCQWKRDGFARDDKFEP